ncbi:hypothetical protein RESH_04615 [Rhodopirellula europaea SH398]|uniref:Uncharacterized protein n=1 Tax=Rhodopirellula europaea SH398 TaxID=1263868 RepID=M5RZF7_9BACT|nr:hypothetical protein RESH_04615 [Rhodopirellula europaea SH398]
MRFLIVLGRPIQSLNRLRRLMARAFAVSAMEERRDEAENAHT